MGRFTVMIANGDPRALRSVANALQPLPDTDVVLEPDSQCAAERLRTNTVHLLIVNLAMHDASGLELLRVARQSDPRVAILMLADEPSVDIAVQCMKLGAADYISKPFRDSELRATVREFLNNRFLYEENVALKQQVENASSYGNLLGKSFPMLKVFGLIERASATDFDVLIIGETGTGKELVARAIHERSPRRGYPFVAVDCGAIPDELMESECFGHERGAFTGAQSTRVGLLESDNHGTFFMDEIAQLPLRLQAKLLRVLQERRIRRVGGTREIDLDLRIIAASSINLQQAVKEGRFRLDLYHRLNVVLIELPPLRERTEDIPLLASYFVDCYAAEVERECVKLSPEALEVLCSHPWPGNVRELQNAIKRTLALCQCPTVTADCLPPDVLAGARRMPNNIARGFFAMREQRMRAFEKEYFTVLLKTWNGDVTKVSREAGVPRGTLYRLLRRNGLDPNTFRQAS